MWEIQPLKLPASEWWNTDPGFSYREFVDLVSKMNLTLKWVYTVIYPSNGIIISQDLLTNYNNVSKIHTYFKRTYFLNTYVS